MNSEKSKGLTHVAGTFLIQADGAFLNGAGIDPGREDRNTTIPKSYRDGVGNRVPYVSAQAWRHWLRNTLIEETGWPVSVLRAIGLSEKGTTAKIAGELNPVDFPEDDIFGYMSAAKGQGRETAFDTDGEERTEGELQREKDVRFFRDVVAEIKSVQTGKQGRGKKAKELPDGDRLERARKVVAAIQKEAETRLLQDEEAFEEDFSERLESIAQLVRDAVDLNSVLPRFSEEVANLIQAFDPGKLKAIMRSSPFVSSLLVSVRRKGWEGLDKGFVHLQEGTPLPYNTEFYNTHLQGVFCLDYGRLGVFWNLGDRIELDEGKVERLLQTGKISVLKDHGERGKVYEMTNAPGTRKVRASAVFRALALLRGGAKQAQFGTDVSPKVLILAGLSCGNPIFNHLFTDGGDAPEVNIGALKEVIRDYGDRIVGPVLIGLRTGYVKNDEKVRDLNGWWVIKGNSNGTRSLEGPFANRPDKDECVEVRVMTPREAATCIGECLP